MIEMNTSCLPQALPSPYLGASVSPPASFLLWRTTQAWFGGRWGGRSIFLNVPTLTRVTLGKASVPCHNLSEGGTQEQVLPPLCLSFPSHDKMYSLRKCPLSTYCVPGTQSDRGRPNSHPLWAHSPMGKTDVWPGSFQDNQNSDGDTQATAEPAGTLDLPQQGAAREVSRGKGGEN